MAQAGARFASSLLRALKGERGITEPAYVASPVALTKGVPYFATNVTLGRNGVETVHPTGVLSEYEQKLFDAAIPELKKSIEKGVEFAAK